MINIRLATKDDEEQVYTLWQKCFRDPESFADYYFAHIYSYNRVFVLEEKKTILAMLHLNPYRIFIDGQVTESEYIVGVATDPDCRRRGFMRKLIEKALDTMWGEEIPFTYLMPAKEELYTPFQFTFIYSQRILEFKKKRTLPDEDVYPLQIHSTQAVTANLAELADFANTILMQQLDVFAYRDKDYFLRLLLETKSEGGEIRLLYHYKKLIGYAAYAVEDEKRQQLLIRELLYLPEAKADVWKWIEQYFGIKRGRILLIPFSEEPGMQISNRGRSYKKPIIMARIVHVEKFMKFIPVPENFSLRICVIDPLIRQNHGKYVWRSGKRFEPIDERAQVDVTIPVEGLTSWIFGYQSVEDLRKKGVICFHTKCQDQLKRVAVINKILLNEIV